MSAKPKTKPKGNARTKTPRPSPATLPASAEVLLSKTQILAALGISLRTLASMLASGEFPRADLRIRDLPRWRVATLNRWIDGRSGGEKATGEQPNGGGVQAAE